MLAPPSSCIAGSRLECRTLFTKRHTTPAKPLGLLEGVIENLKLLFGLSVEFRSQHFVRCFPLVADHFLQGESVSIQLLGKMQQCFQIDGTRWSFLGNLRTHVLHRKGGCICCFTWFE